MKALPFLLILFFAACGPKDAVVAKVGPLKITQSEFQRKLLQVASNYQNYVATPNGRRQFLDILLREKLVLAAAQASSTSKSADYRIQLERLKAEEDERLRESRDDLLVRLWIDDLRRQGSLKVGEDEIRDYHKKHDQEFVVRHILCSSAQEAEEMAKKARGGANFAVLAKQRSLDGATALDGGRMQASLDGEFIPEIEDIVRRMKVGEVAGPVKSKFGYHVLKKDAQKSLTLAQAHGRIARLLAKQKLDRTLQAVQEKFPVEVVDEQFK